MPNVSHLNPNLKSGCRGWTWGGVRDLFVSVVSVTTVAISVLPSIVTYLIGLLRVSGLS